ncbi:MAG: GNAT family N-acetyltransferase [Magnetococcales bacterium]|nr:GNAT family N-acetyltransferase [Magnetococcales bacterium]
MTEWSLQALDAVQWQRYWQQAVHCSLTQSWQYGSAMAQRYLCRCHRFAISDQQGSVRGLLQMLSWSLPWVGGVARINRGPIVCGPSWTLTEQGHFLTALRQRLHSHRCRFLKAAFAMPDQADLSFLLEQHGYYRQKEAPAWGSHRLLLQQEVATLRGCLSGKWRNLLGKSERQGVEVRLETATACWPRFTAFYSDFVQQKEFTGIDLRFLHTLARQSAPTWQWNLFSCFLPEAPDLWIGVVVTIHHGDTATYLIGASNEQGRQRLCNYQLLWQAMLHARLQGMACFDLGGVNEATAEGIRHFKAGLNGTPYRLIGEWVFKRGLVI